jgi:hypothetical protein
MRDHIITHMMENELFAKQQRLKKEALRVVRIRLTSRSQSWISLTTD